MSYSILYNRLFVRLSDDSVIALVEAGDNNLYDVDYATGREKRARSWEAWSFGENKFSYTIQEIHSYLNRSLKRAIDNRWKDVSVAQIKKEFGSYASIALYGHYCGNTTFGMYSRFFLSGYENAVPFDAFVENVGGLSLCHWNKERGSLEHSGYYTSEEELRKDFDEMKKTHETVWIRPSSSYMLSTLSTMLGTSRKGLTFELGYIDNRNGNHRSGFLKSLFPLTISPDKTEAMRIPKKAWSPNELFSVTSYMMRLQGYDLRSITYN